MWQLFFIIYISIFGVLAEPLWAGNSSQISELESWFSERLAKTSSRGVVGASSVPRCSSLPLQLLAANRGQLSPRLAAAAAPLFLRPTGGVGTVDSPYIYGANIDVSYYETEHFVIWYTVDPESSERHQVPLKDVYDSKHPEGTIPDGVPDYVNYVGDIFEEVYSTMVDSLGYSVPLGDGQGGIDPRYDIYLTDIFAAFGFGYSYPSAGVDEIEPGDPEYLGDEVIKRMDSTEINDSPGYIVIDNDYAEIDYSTSILGSALDAVRVTAAHEFFHLVQYSQDYHNGFKTNDDGTISINTWWSEASAVWAENEVYPAIDDYVRYLAPEVPNILNTTWESIDYFNRKPPHLNYIYSATIWPLSLADDLGPAAIFDIWQAGAQVTELVPDQPALTLGTWAATVQIAEDSGVDFVDIFANYQVRRYFTGSRTEQDKAGDWSLADAAKFSEENLQIQVPYKLPYNYLAAQGSDQLLRVLSGAYHLFEHYGDADIKLSFNAFDDDKVRWGVNYILINPETGVSLLRSRLLDPMTGEDTITISGLGSIYTRVVVNPYILPQAFVASEAGIPLETEGYQASGYRYQLAAEYVNDELPPAVVELLSLAGDDDSEVTLRWQLPDDIDLQGVVVMRSETAVPTGAGDLSSVEVYRGGGSSYVDRNVDQGRYYYAIFAYDELLNYSALQSDTAKLVIDVVDTTAPAGIVANQLAVADGERNGVLQVDLVGYTPPLDLQGYYLYVAKSPFVSTVGEAAYETTRILTGPLQISGLENNTPYYVAVVPFDEAGNYRDTELTKSAIATLRYQVELDFAAITPATLISAYLDGNDSYRGRYLGSFFPGTKDLFQANIYPGPHKVELRGDNSTVSSKFFNLSYDSMVLNDWQMIKKRSQTFSPSPTQEWQLETGDAEIWRALPAYWNNNSQRDLLVGTIGGKVLLFTDPDLTRTRLVSYTYLQVFDPVSDSYLDLEVSGNAAPFVADWDDDGLEDLLVGDSQGQVSFYKRLGDSLHPILVFQEKVQFQGTFSVVLDVGEDAFPVVVDSDDNDKKDLFVAARNGMIYRYVNSSFRDGLPRLAKKELVYDYSGSSEQRFINLDQGPILAFKNLNYKNIYEDLLIFEPDGDLLVMWANKLLSNYLQYSAKNARQVPYKFNYSAIGGLQVTWFNDDQYADLLVFDRAKKTLRLYLGQYVDPEPEPPTHHAKPENCFVAGAAAAAPARDLWQELLVRISSY